MFIHSSVGGQLGCFHFCGIRSSATMDIGVQVFVRTCVSMLLCFVRTYVLLGVDLRVELLGHMIALCLTF